MAFSMSQVKLKKKNRDIRMYFAVINQLDNISDNTKLILNTYLRSRVKKYGIPLCNEETWKYQLKCLLKYCCGKEYIDITAKGYVDIGGFMPWPGGHTIAENCSVSGKIDATGVDETCRVGGFFGNLGWNCDLGHMGHEITDCTADVDIVTKKAPAGGFVGTERRSALYRKHARRADRRTVSGEQDNRLDIG